MADIRIVRAHSMPLKKARAAAQDFAAQLEEKFELQSEWHGDTMHFERSGVKGTLRLARDQVTIDAQLGFLLSAFNSTFEGHINDNLDRLFGGAAVRKAAKKKA